MDRMPVVSSTLRAVGYDAGSNTLEIEFRHGGVYRYQGVAPLAHEALLSAPSKGKHFHAHIRDRYPTIRVR